MSSETEYTVGHFMEDVKAILREKGSTDEGLREITQRMQVLSARDDLLEQGPIRIIPPGREALEVCDLYSDLDDTLILAIARFAHEHPTTTHNHNTWGVICPYKGRIHYEGWERVDDVSKPGYAELKLHVKRDLEPGEALYWLPYPRDIHRQQAHDEQGWEIFLMGKGTQGTSLLHFDPEQHKVWDVAPG